MQHPDEGTIHAWLDGALAPAEAQAVEAHIASCPECAAAIANARGVLAAASRILSALDNVPGDVLPASSGGDAGRPSEEPHRALTRDRFSATRWRAAAAIVLVGGVSWFVAQRWHAPPRYGASDITTVAMTASSTPVTLLSLPPALVMAYDSTRVMVHVAAPEAQSRRPAATSSAQIALADTSAAYAAPALARAYARTDGAGAQEMTARRNTDVRQRATSVVVDRTRVDSVLAADSARVLDRGPALEERVAAMSKRMAATPSAAAPSAGMAAQAPSVARDLDATSVTAAAAGCWALTSTAWRSTDPQGHPAPALLPAQLELRRALGVSGDEQGNHLARPTPGTPSLPAGAVGFWKLLGADRIRVTFADDTSWVVLTLVVSPESIAGPARAWSSSTAMLRSADVTGKRTACGP